MKTKGSQANQANRPRVNEGLESLLHGLRNSLRYLEELSQVVKSWQPETGLEKKRQITYEEAIEFFLDNQPRRFERAAMMRERRGRGYVFSQVYLDQRDNLVRDSAGKVVGRQLWVERLDSELTEVFADKDIVIVE